MIRRVLAWMVCVSWVSAGCDEGSSPSATEGTGGHGATLATGTGGEGATVATGAGGEGATGAMGTGGEGGSTSGEGGAVPATAWQKYCAAQTARDEMCDPAQPPDDYEACAAKEAQCVGFFHGPAIEAAAECIVLDCGNDDACFADATHAAPVFPDYLTACRATFDACPELGNKQDDYCDGVAVASAATLADLGACLELACDAVRDCFHGVFDAVDLCD